MPSKARQKKIIEKLNRAQKCSILGPQNRAPGAPLDPHLFQLIKRSYVIHVILPVAEHQPAQACYGINIGTQNMISFVEGMQSHNSEIFIGIS